MRHMSRRAGDAQEEPDCLIYDDFCRYITEDIYGQRSITANLDESAKDEVLAVWQILTLRLREEGGKDMILQGTLTGVSY